MLIGKQTKQKYLDSLSIEQLHLKNLVDTIGDSYINGIEAADEKWREAVSEFLKENEMPQALMCKIYSKLQEL